MRSLFKVIFVFAAAVIMGCGSATEVGNPTSEIPTLRTIEGVIDVSTIEEAKSVALQAVDPTTLTVVATATDGSVKESMVDVDGFFAIDVELGKTYSLEVLMQGEVVGPFSFEQDEMGNRANRLQITQRGSPIDMGQVRFQDGVFIPENEPRRQMGNGSGGM